MEFVPFPFHSKMPSRLAELRTKTLHPPFPIHNSIFLWILSIPGCHLGWQELWTKG